MAAEGVAVAGRLAAKVLPRVASRRTAVPARATTAAAERRHTSQAGLERMRDDHTCNINQMIAANVNEHAIAAQAAAYGRQQEEARRQLEAKQPKPCCVVS